MRWFNRHPKLRHVLFWWLALTIVTTAFTMGVIFRLGHGTQGSIELRSEAALQLAKDSFERTFDDDPARQRLAEGLLRAFSVSSRLHDATGAVLLQTGPQCADSVQVLELRREGARIGHVELCFGRPKEHFAGTFFVALLGALFVLWGAAAFLARRLTRPLYQLIAVTREIGSGNLGARVRLGRHGKGELKTLADSVNEMAGRIERQLRDQRELLAVVSHEVRSPLSRIRVCTELLRSEADVAQTLDSLDREVEELDTLLGKLLAHSRLDFGTLAKSEVCAHDLLCGVLSRRGIESALAPDVTQGACVEADVTLVNRALDNVLDNAERYGRAPLHARVRWATQDERGGDGAAVVFEIRDSGDGFDPKALPRVFEAFYQSGETKGAEAAGLGLGLSLVKRIARAHGGHAWAFNAKEGGACVAMSLQASHTAARAKRE